MSNAGHISSLTPTHIGKGEKSYLPVDRLRESLKDNSIHNIALTGPFGSGKSSVIRTLVDEERENYHFLEISLATLDVKKEKKSKADAEVLSKKIELGILQQLVYREKDSTLPYSRFRRIHFFENDEVTRYVIMIILAVVCFAIAFEPSWLKIDSFCKQFRLGEWKIFFDAAAVFYLLVFFWIFLHWVIEKYWGSKFSKLNLTDGEIEVKESGSIFNEHLEEIMYFFQATKYEVVVLEDLDRFDNSDVFLKLRELNYLLNHTKVMNNRKIVFIYAVKDDLFNDTSRTKFFDYIVPVIPIMNMSNASGLLKNELLDMGYSDISDEDLEDIAGFIDDMRILHNIANEYHQYREQLMGESNRLKPEKLLALIVYKNYFPDEFSLMHQQKGRIMAFINQKGDYIEYARMKVLAKQREIIENNYQVKVANSHLKMKDLRTLYVYSYRRAINDQDFDKFVIDGNTYDDDAIIDNDELFEKLIAQDSVHYKKRRSYQTYTHTIDFKGLEKRVSETPYKTRKNVIQDEVGEIDTLMGEIQNRDEELNTYTISKLMMQFPINEVALFKDLNLKPMEELFLMRGYISEDYYDYISYFYSGMITENDQQLLLEMKLGRKLEFRRKIDKIDNFMQKLPSYVYTTESVLNLQVVDWLARHHEEKKLVLVVNQIRASQHTLRFLVVFNREKWQYRDEVNRIYMHHYHDQAWTALTQCDILEDKNVLRAIWFRWAASKDITRVQREWLNENYGFVSGHVNEIGLTKAGEIMADSKVTALDNVSPQLLDSALMFSNYVINERNLLVICSYKTGHDIDKKDLTYAKLLEINSPEFKSYITANMNRVVKLLMNTSEEPINTQVDIINNGNVEEKVCLDYISKQTLMVERIEDVIIESRIKPLYQSDSVLPTWGNVCFYLNKYGGEDILYAYIRRHVYVLISLKLDLDEDAKFLLYKNLLLSNGLEMDVYKKLVTYFDYTIDDSVIDDMDEVEQERLAIMLSKRKIAYSKRMREWFFNKPLYSEYMLFHKDKLLKDYDQVEYNHELALGIMDSRQIKVGQKLRFIPYFPAILIMASIPLANKLCHFLKNRDLKLSHNQVLSIIDKCNVESDRVLYAALNIQNNSTDLEYVKNILKALGGQFKLLVENGNPKFEKNNHNIKIISVLEEIDYISSKKEQTDYIRVYTKNK